MSEPSASSGPGSSGPWLGIIADDITGATDAAAYVMREGQRVVQLFGVPQADPPGVRDADCVVVALKSRSIPAADAVALSLEACVWLESLGVEHVYFKYCSTFDSTDVGNIGPVADALAEHRDETQVVVVPSAPENGRTVYRSRLFVHDELLSESPMRHHPLNPMTKSDLRELLAPQSSAPAVAVTLPDVLAGAATVEARLAGVEGRVNVVGDAVTDADLEVWGQVAISRRVSSGSAGLAAGLARARRGHPGAIEAGSEGSAAALSLPDGPVLVLSGSCSSATLAQVARFRADHPSYRLQARRLVDDAEGHVAEAIGFVRSALERGETPLVFSSQPPDQLAAVQADLGAARASEVLERATGAVARAGVDLGVRRLVVAGGETSGAVVAALDVPGIAIGAEVAPGVPWTVTLTDPALALLLKSGNFGGPRFFEEAVTWL